MAAQIIKLLEDFQQKNTVLQQRAASLGGEKDNAEFRAKLFDMRETLKQLAKKITILFKEKGATEDKRVITKLKTQFETELNIFKTTTQQIEAKEKQILISMSVQGDSPLTRADSKEALQYQQLQQNVGPAHEVVQDHLLMIQAKQDSIIQIEKDVVMLNEMFKDLNFLVVSQQEGIDLIENHIDETKKTTAAAHTDLVEAQDYQKASRRNMCCIVVILIIVLAAVALGTAGGLGAFKSA